MNDAPIYTDVSKLQAHGQPMSCFRAIKEMNQEGFEPNSTTPNQRINKAYKTSGYPG